MILVLQLSLKMVVELQRILNDYIGDQYIESKKNNDTVYYNDSIQITLNKKNKVKKVELFTDHYQVEGNFYVGLEKKI